jgi:hypothetical protein
MTDATAQGALPPIAADVKPLQSAVGSFLEPGSGGVRNGWLFLFPDRLVFVAGPGNMLWYPVPTPSGSKARDRYEKRARQREKGVVEIPVGDIADVKRGRILFSWNTGIHTKSGKDVSVGDKTATWEAPIRSVVAANGIAVIDTEHGFQIS